MAHLEANGYHCELSYLVEASDDTFLYVWTAVSEATRGR